MILKDKLANNTLFNILGQVASAVFVFILTPYILKKIGLVQFGFWAILSTIILYYNYFDLGVSSSYIRFVAAYHARKDREGVRQVIATAFFYSLCLAIVIIALGLLLKGPILSFVVRKQLDAVFTGRLYVLILLLFSLNYTGFVFKAVLDGLQRMDLANLLTVLQRTANFILSILLLKRGLGLSGLIISGLVASALFLVATYLVSIKLLPDLSLSPRLFSFAKLRDMVVFGVKYQTTTLCLWVTFNVNKIALGVVGALSTVAFFDVAQKISMAARNIPTGLLSALVPRASEIHARGDKEEMRQLYHKTTRILMVLIVPINFFILFNARYIVTAWVGEALLPSVIVVQLYTLGSIVNLITGTGTSIVRGINRPEIETKYLLLMTAINLGLLVALVRKYELIGAACAIMLAFILASLYFFYYYHRLEGISNRVFFRETLMLPLIWAILFSIAIYYINVAMAAHGIRPNLLYLLFEGILFQFCFTVTLHKMRYVDIYQFLRLRGVG